jgi:hypothetical protein
MRDLPHDVAQLVDLLVEQRGAVAVVLGGSQALRTNVEASDWDLGLYYRNPIDLAPLAALGDVHPPGSWGRIMNGGAWLKCGEAKVDVILRDLDIVEEWTKRTEEGQFEVDALLGYLAGVPTYLLTAELAMCEVLRGEIPSARYPEKLATVATPWWRFRRSFSLDYARAHARSGDLVGATGQAAKAVMEEAHAVLCERRLWTCNEKHLVDDAGLARVRPHFGHVPSDPARLVAWVDQVAGLLGVPAVEVVPWSDAGRGT